MRLYDHEQGQWVEVPEAQVPEALRSLRFTAEAGTMIPIMRDGKRGNVPAEDAHKFFKKDKRTQVESFNSRDDYRSIKNIEDGGLGALTAGAFGVARGVSVGTSDAIIPEITEALGGDGDMARKRIRALKAEHPTASTVGDVIGTVAPAVLSGGSSVLARGAVMTPAGATAALGLVTEREIAKQILKRGVNSQIAQKAIPMAAGAVAEGAIYGAGHQISEAALGDRELTAENLLAGMGVGAVLGGGIGGSVGATIGAIKATSRVGKEALGAMYKNVTGVDLSSKAADLYAESVGKMAGLQGKNPREVKSIVKDFINNPDKVKAAQRDANEIVEQGVSNLRGPMDEAHKAFSDLTEEQGGFLKMKNMEKLMRRGNETEVLGASVEQLDDVVNKLSGLSRGEMNKKSLRTLQERAIALRASMPDMAKTHGTKANDVFFSEMDALKRDIGRWTESFVPKTTVQQKALSQIRSTVREPMEKHLERVDLWGDAAVAQQEVNAALHSTLNMNRHASKQGWFARMAREDHKGKDVWAVRPEAIRSFLKNMDRPNSMEAEFIREHVRRQRAYADSLLKHYEGGNVNKLAQDIKRGADAFEAEIKAVEKELVPINQMKVLDQLGGHGSQLNDAALRGILPHLGLGGLVGGLPGVGVGAAAYALSNPAGAIKKLAALKSIASKTEKVTRPMAKKFVQGAKRGFKKVDRVAPGVGRTITRGARSAYLGGLNLGQPQHKDKRRQFVALQSKVGELVKNPEALSMQVAENMKDVADVAPELTATVALKSAQALAFIHQEMEIIRPERQSLSRTSQRGISDTALRRLEETVTLVTDPTALPRSLASGRYVPNRLVNAWSTLWPKISEEFVDEMITEFATIEGGIPRQEAAKLSVMFGYPFDETYDPMFVARVQQRQQVTGKAEQPVVPGSVKRTDITLRARRKTLDDHQTGGQRLSNQEEIS